ncbi:hypothetical protein M9H77_14473 [Catharanthus roseus]|uniref:Uncharacterized protein n=1 Tax=Catharanthus roseus TaxID=4058 RepID=A0ACC0BNF7_CATRO|nr:hypothetical protein M9H77_14473 [Catharanthus roseus]
MWVVAVSTQKIYNVVAKIKKNRMQGYNMPLLEAVGMTPTGKNFTIAIAFMRNEQGKRFKPVIEEMLSTAYHMLCRRHIDQNVLIKLTEMIKDEEVASRFINGSWHKLLNETNKSSLEDSRLKEKLNAKSNMILKNRAPEIIDDPKNKCGHYLMTSHGLPCSCELITRLEHMLPIQLDDIEAFWRTLEIDGYHLCSQEKYMDMDSEIHAHLAKGVLSLVLPEDLGITLTSPLEVIATKGRRKTNSTKKDRSYWEHVSIAHRKINDSISGSGSRFGSGSRGRGRPPRAPRGRGRGHSNRRTNAFNLYVVLIARIGSTTVLPQYSYSECTGILVIEHLAEQ